MLGLLGLRIITDFTDPASRQRYDLVRCLWQLDHPSVVCNGFISAPFFLVTKTTPKQRIRLGIHSGIRVVSNLSVKCECLREVLVRIGDVCLVLQLLQFQL